MTRIFTAVSLIAMMICYAAAAKVYLMEEDTLSNHRLHDKAAPLLRPKRQTHPGATIAKLPTQDTGAFIPIVGPTQTLASQPPFFQNTESFQNTLEFPSSRDTPIDYLVPPNPDSHISSLNFQNPSANLQTIDNVFDVTSPASSSSNNLASFQSFQNSFPSSQPNFQNQINLPQVSTTQSSITTNQINSASFQNPQLAPSSTPSFVQNPGQFSITNQLLTNKISSPSKEPLLLTSQFPIIPAQFANPNTFNNAEPPQQPDRSTQGSKWELGFDANEILAPPREDSFGRNSEYDTINVPKFRRLNSVGASPPQPPNPIQPTHPNANQFAAPNQFPSPAAPNTQQFSQFHSFASPPSHNFVAPNDQFSPPNNQFVPASNLITTASSQPNTPVNNPNNIVWGSQKQPFNYAPTTNAPFLPTVPPTQQSQLNNFQNVPVAPFNPSQQNQPPQLQQFQPPPSNNQLYHLQNVNVNQNFAVETPLNSQFDSFLPQGTVSDHSFPSRFRKRQVNSEEDDDIEDDREEPESKYQHKAEIGMKSATSDGKLIYVPRLMRRQHHEGVTGPVKTFAKTNHHAHFSWGVKHHVGHGFA